MGSIKTSKRASYGRGGIAVSESKRKKLTAGQEQSEQKLEGNDYIRLLHKLIIYTKLANYENIRNRLITILDSEDKKRVFAATDGNNSTRQIESITGVSKDTVSNWWDEWEREGIVEESEEVRGRRRRIVLLSEFGIEVPGGRRQRSKRQKLNKGNKRQD